MGAARDRLVEKAQSSTQDVVQKAEQVAKTVVSEPERLMQSEEQPAPPR
jgi:hypothetical protein